MPILNYTTAVDAGKTVAEIQALLVKAKASRIMVDYENEQPIAMTFRLHDHPFRLPCRWQAVQKILRATPQEVSKRGATEARALRIAWRILKDWVEAQLALIQTGMVASDEVFMPYMIVTGDEKTVYEVYLRSDRILPLRNE